MKDFSEANVKKWGKLYLIFCTIMLGIYGIKTLLTDAEVRKKAPVAVESAPESETPSSQVTKDLNQATAEDLALLKSIFRDVKQLELDLNQSMNEVRSAIDNGDHQKAKELWGKSSRSWNQRRQLLAQENALVTNGVVATSSIQRLRYAINGYISSLLLAWQEMNQGLNGGGFPTPQEMQFIADQAERNKTSAIEELKELEGTSK